MPHTNNFIRLGVVLLVAVACTNFVTPGWAAADKVELRKRFTAVELRCFRELFHQRPLRYSPTEINKFRTETEVGRADLTGNGRYSLIFVVHDVGYCGSAGCLMLIAQPRSDGKCHMLAEASSDGGEITVLNRRDYGYRRLYAPCELYFDGQQYQLVREECPNIDVPR